MPRLADVVRLAPNFLLGSVVSRAARLRTLESWVITRVHPARGGGNPAVYGVRFEAAAAAATSSASSASIAANSNNISSNSAATKRVLLPVSSAPTRIDGLLKPDWLVVRDANRAAPARKASIVRTNVGFSLSNDLVAAVLRGDVPFDGVGEDVARARANVAATRKTSKIAAAALIEAAASKIAADAAAAAIAKEVVTPEKVAAKA